MRNCIIWTHWVWKSSLIEELKIISNTNFIEEIARSIIDKTKLNPKDMIITELKDFQYMLLQEQIKREYNLKDFISDRSVIDILAYSSKLDIYENMFKRIKDYLKHFPYDNIFYIPIEFELEKDWLRFEDEEYRKYIDFKILDICKKLWLEVIVVKWTIENRIKTILEAL